MDGLIFADEKLMRDIRGDEAVKQVANVAQLPGIVGRSIGMPDIHWGYGFAIGGVAAFDPGRRRSGVPGRGRIRHQLWRSAAPFQPPVPGSLTPHLPKIMDRLFETVPAGVGKGYKKFVLSADGHPGDPHPGCGLGRGGRVSAPRRIWTTSKTEGAIPGADPDQVSDRAIQRGRDQVGTVGSGNHFIEVGEVEEVYDQGAAERLGLEAGAVTVLIHSGSRGLGYQVCDDYLDVMLRASRRYGIDLPDKQLVCAPLESPEAETVPGGHAGCRQLRLRESPDDGAPGSGGLRSRPGPDRPELGMGLDLRRGPQHRQVREAPGGWAGDQPSACTGRVRLEPFLRGTRSWVRHYKDLGQPVFIPGDMGRYSYVLLGTEGAYAETFGSTCHGAGRRMSRRQAKKQAGSRNLRDEFEELGIQVRASSFATVAEEIPEAYKDVADVVDVVDRAGIGRKVARLKPLGVLKG